jgi:hypothetical protein
MDPKKQRTSDGAVLVRAQAQPRKVTKLLDLPPELLGEILGHYIRDPAPWKTHPKTLRQVNRSIDALEGISTRAAILRLVLPTTSRVTYGLKRQYVTTAMLIILRKQKMLIERHHSTHLECIDGAALRAIYESTYYQIWFVQAMVKDGIEDHQKWRFVVERLKKVEPYAAYAGFVGGRWEGGLQQVVQM